MLYLAIPAQNEVATIGVLLWRLRTVLAEFPREYEVVVYDDASTDETADVAEQYMHAMPVTVLRGKTPIGYAGAVNALVRHIANHTRYPRRDAMLLLQGDFTDPPGIVPEFARRFEGGADLVIGERASVADAPRAVRRLFTAVGWALKPFVRVEGISDLTGSMRLMRISALRDLLRTGGDDPVCDGDTWTANADLLLRLVPHARRVETVPVEPTFGVRTRETRRVAVRDALAALRWAWQARGRRAVPTSAPEGSADGSARNARPAATGRRRDEPEVTADRLRERSRERDRLRGDTETTPARRDGRPARDRDARAPRTEEQKAQRRQELREDPREERRETPGVAPATVPVAAPRPPRPERQPREPRPPREPRRGRSAPVAADAELILDDPFAGPTARQGAEPHAEATRASTSDADVTRPGEDLDLRSMAARTTPADGPGADDDAAAGIDRTAARATDADAMANDDGTFDAEASTDVAEGAEGAEGRERKRRRNRRSRRRKSRLRGEPGSEQGDDASAGDGASEATAATPAEPDGPYADDRDDDDDGTDDQGAEAAIGGEPAGSAEDDAEGGPAARARRRGRRGRRGGSRRSRGRGRDGADANDRADAGAEPPPPSSEAE